jgi:hypothetical protein
MKKLKKSREPAQMKKKWTLGKPEEISRPATKKY